MEELTAGQAAVLVRNEQDIDRSTEELDDLEETLNESIADSLRGAKQKAGGADPPKKKKKRCGTSTVVTHCCDQNILWSHAGPSGARHQLLELGLSTHLTVVQL